jgi:deoxycytidylate deaminase
MVVNAPPCVRCLMRAKNAGIARVYYTGEYANAGSQAERDALVGPGIELARIEVDFRALVRDHVLRVLDENDAAFSQPR